MTFELPNPPKGYGWSWKRSGFVDGPILILGAEDASVNHHSHIIDPLAGWQAWPAITQESISRTAGILLDRVALAQRAIANRAEFSIAICRANHDPSEGMF